MGCLTEEQAREKWCPLLGQFNEPQKCCASMCMAWRWAEHWEPGEQIHEPGGGSYTTEKPSPSRGYCGLSGKPEATS